METAETQTAMEVRKLFLRPLLESRVNMPLAQANHMDEIRIKRRGNRLNLLLGDALRPRVKGHGFRRV